MDLTADHVWDAPEDGIARRAVAFGSEAGRLVVRETDRPAPDTLALAALVNTHDHGYGLPPLAVGAPDDALECWIHGLANRPATDPKLEAMVAFGRMALTGIGTTVHFHNSGRRDRVLEEAGPVAEAAKAVGIRVAFSSPIADRNPVVYGDHDQLAALGYVPAAGAPAYPLGAEQIAAAKAVAAEHGSDTFNVQLGPIGPQWCRPETLEAIAATSAETGMRVQMHLLETERQRQYLDSIWPEGPVRRLDTLGLLSPRLTVAHGVWLREDECALLAERGVTVAVNSSSNLRLRSGIAPVAHFLAAGLNFGLGLDGGGLDDDQDMFRELSLFQRLQSGMGLVQQMPVERVLASALRGGFRAFDGSNDYGTLRDGARADVVVVDLARIRQDILHDTVPLADVVLARARRRDVRDLMVAGRRVVADGRLAGFDFVAAEAELVAQARARAPAVDAAGQRTNREAIRRYYLDGRHI